MYVAVGSGGTSTIAWSSDGMLWTGLGNTIFATAGRGITSIGSMWVATGNGTNSIAYSTDGKTWTGSASGNSVFTTQGNSVTWTGIRFVAVGSGTNTIGHSPDGITWYASINGNTIFTQANGVAGNSRIGPIVVDSQTSSSDTHAIVSDSYYNKGYTTFSASIQTQQLSS
jgi:hypothetical protein